MRTEQFKIIYFMQSSQGKIYFLIRCEILFPHTNSSNLVSALNATVAVQRVRSRQSQSEEGKEEPTVLVSQVLNPELPLNQSGNIRKESVFS